jgi:hypothetical protein
MNLNIIKNKGILLLFAMAAIVNFTSCQPEDSFADNGLTPTTVEASFTVTPVEGKVNVYKVAAQPKGVMRSLWDTGTGFVEGKMDFEISLPDAGTYTISHTAIGAGGATAVATQELVVATSDPEKGNILSGGKLKNSDDWSKWTVTNPTSSANIVFASGSATLTASGWAGNGIYQAINVVAGKKYVIDMLTSSTTGCSNTWFEVYCGYSAPVTGTDYSEGGKLRALSTWDGCATAAFSGKISVVGCKAENNLGIFTATKTGTAYLVIRGGGEDMKAGIKIQDIEMRPSL